MILKRFHEEPERSTPLADFGVTLFWSVVVALLVGATTSGCSTRVEVQSDTAWTKTVNGSRTYGEGDATFPVSSSRAVFDFQKDTDGGYLRARAVRGRRADDWQETREPRGSVRVVVK